MELFAERLEPPSSCLPREIPDSRHLRRNEKWPIAVAGRLQAGVAKALLGKPSGSISAYLDETVMGVSVIAMRLVDRTRIRAAREEL